MRWLRRCGHKEKRITLKTFQRKSLETWLTKQKFSDRNRLSLEVVGQ